VSSCDVTSPSRRTLLRTAAWSVPAVSVVAAAPAFAASTVTGTISVVAMCGQYSNPTFAIVNDSSAAIPADSTITVTNAGTYTFYELDGGPLVGPSGDTVIVLGTAIPSGGLMWVYPNYDPEAYPNPSMTLTPSAGFQVPAGSTLTAATTGNACDGSINRRSSQKPIAGSTSA